jgi:hypothetical protein
MISDNNPEIYDSEADNKKYKDYMLKNVDAIIQMNSDCKKSSAELIKYIEFMKRNSK